MVITVGGIKGGSGKSTLATNFAAIHSIRGHDTVLVDADEQATSADFTALRSSRLGRPGYEFAQAHGRDVLARVRVLALTFQAVVIDVGGRDTASQRAALVASDVAVFPFVPRPYDLWTLEALTSLLSEVREVNPGLLAMSYINRADTTRLTSETRALLAGAEEQGIEFCDLRLGNRVAYADAAGQGLSVEELVPRDRGARQATAEMVALRDYILDFSHEAKAKHRGLTHEHAS